MAVKFKINLPFMKLELDGDEKQLVEIRKILSELNKLSLVDLEAEALDELLPSMPIWQLSPELQKKEKVISNLSQLSQVEDGMVVKKTSLENISEITDSGSVSKVNIDDAKTKISKLFYDLDSNKINYAFIHAMGNLQNDSFSIIFDQVKKQLPNAKIECNKTKKEVMGKTVVECVLFGSFPED